MKILILLLLCIYCTTAFNTTIPPITSTKNASTSTKTASEASQEGKEVRVVRNTIQKPRFVVTFMSNMRSFPPGSPQNDSNSTQESLKNSQEVVPYVFDPFQKMLQFLFSSIMQDFARVSPFRENSSLNLPNTSEESKETPKEIAKCEHSELGFCKNCNFAVSTTAKNVGKTIEHVEKPQLKKKKHRRHYFLSISGGTDNCTTAETIRGRFKRSKEVINYRKSNSSINKVGPTVDMVDALNVLNAHEGYAKVKFGEIEHEISERADVGAENTSETSKRKEPIKKRADKGTVATKPATEPEEDVTIIPVTSGPNDDEWIAPDDIYTDHLGNIYKVTIPTAITFSICIVGLCFCLRTRGFCCQLFLTEPSQTLREKREKKPNEKITKPKKKAKK